jgi:hypothetical protein
VCTAQKSWELEERLRVSSAPARHYVSSYVWIAPESRKENLCEPQVESRTSCEPWNLPCLCFAQFSAEIVHGRLA